MLPELALPGFAGGSFGSEGAGDVVVAFGEVEVGSGFFCCDDGVVWRWTVFGDLGVA